MTFSEAREYVVPGAVVWFDRGSPAIRIIRVEPVVGIATGRFVQDGRPMQLSAPVGRFTPEPTPGRINL